MSPNPSKMSMSEGENQRANTEPSEKTDVSILTPQFKDGDKAASEDRFAIQLQPDDDPKGLPSLRKWITVLVVCSGALCATCASSVVSHALAFVVPGGSDFLTVGGLC